jgi:hypothetical protein
MNSINDILAAFQNLRANDTNTMKGAEKSIIEFMRQPECIPAFMNIIASSDIPVVRSCPFLIYALVPPDGSFVFAKGD